jgi:beta-galactosidase
MQALVKLILVLAMGAGFTPIVKAAQDSLPNGTGAPGSVVLNDSWRLWLDNKAEWQNDKLFLPDEVNLAAMPANSPTGGWETLNDQMGISVTLPGTVEEHYWGQAPLPVAGSRPQDVLGLSSPYKGVSWWYRTFSPPDLKSGERLIFSFPGARLRAEVYVNGKLVGYSLVTETPFTADATSALEPGRPNQLAVRITNPGGTFSWGDYGLQEWGSYKFPVSHGFGGLDGGVTMSVHGPVCVEDLYVANNPDPHTITLSAEVDSTGPAYRGPLALSITRGGKEVWGGTVDVEVSAGGKVNASKKVTVPDAELWDIGHPVLYQAAAGIASIPHSDRTTEFGFRWFNAEGLGTNAHLELNGRRIVVKSAISWGYWAPNGMFPDQAAVQREIDAVHAIGLNCVQNHRHFPKAAVLDGFDHAGLLRYCEPGGGGWAYEYEVAPKFPNGPVDTSGQGGEPLNFINRYETAKVLAMIKAYRSHPSVPLWTLLNEGGANLHNTRIFQILRKMRELDPSRIVLLKSGYAPAGEVMGLPYSNAWTYNDGSANFDSDWHDTHTCNNYEGVYLDQFYKGPTDYTYYTTEAKAISAWGEMATGSSVDDATSIAHWYQQQNIPGYDRAAAEALSSAYEKFLDTYGFHSAYPTAETLFRQIGNKHYFSAARVMENARMADANDYIVLSGWESTTVDNHCALVDALRHPKGDPGIMSAATASELLIVRPLHYVIAKGDSAVADVHIVNEVNRHGSFTLRFSAAMDTSKDKPFFTASYPVHVTGGEIFGELLKESIAFVPPETGPLTMTASLSPADGVNSPILQRTEPLLVVDPQPGPVTGTVACADFDGKLIPTLQRQFGVAALPASPSI